MAKKQATVLHVVLSVVAAVVITVGILGASVYAILYVRDNPPETWFPESGIELDWFDENSAESSLQGR